MELTVDQKTHSGVQTSSNTKIKSSSEMSKPKTARNEVMDNFSKEREATLRQRQKEISELRIQNKELVRKLKKFSEEVNKKMEKMKLTKQEPTKQEDDEARLVNELESLETFKTVYQKERKQLKAKLSLASGTEAVIDKERKLAQTLEMKNTEKLSLIPLLEGNLTEFSCTYQKRIKQLEKEVHWLERELDRANHRVVNGVPQIEEEKLLQIFNNTIEHSEELEEKMKRNNELNIARDSKISELRSRISSLEAEINKLQTLTKQEINNVENEELSLPKVSDTTVDSLRESFQRLKGTYESEHRDNQREIKSQKDRLEALIQLYKELCQRNKINSHNILEFSRMIRQQKSSSTASLHLKKSVMQIKKEELNARLLKMKKFHRLKLKRKTLHSLNSSQKLPTERLEPFELSPVQPPSTKMKIYQEAEVQAD